MYDAVSDIRQRAEAIGLPLGHILAQANVDWSTWGRWCKGRHSPTGRVLNRLDDALKKHETQVEATPISEP